MTFGETLKNYRYWLVATLAVLAGVYRDIASQMASDWYHDGNYSHGFLVPLISCYFVYLRRRELGRAKVSPLNAGLFVILLALGQLMAGWLAREYFTMRSSLVLLLAGMILFFFGSEVFRLLVLPVLYLLFMVPLPYIVYEGVAFPLKLFVTRVSVFVLHLLGVVVVREGNILMFPATTLEVADACSGIRSLLSLLALAVAYAFLVDTSLLRRWIIILSAIPIAILTNSIRVIVTGIIAQHWGGKAAQGFFHEFAGLAVFALAMIMQLVLGALVRGKGPREGGEGDGE